MGQSSPAENAKLILDRVSIASSDEMHLPVFVTFVSFVAAFLRLWRAHDELRGSISQMKAC